MLDDRAAGAGEKLTDAELLGCPLRIVVGKRTLAEGQVEAQERRSGHRAPAGGRRRGAAGGRDPLVAVLTMASPRSKRRLFGIDRSGPLPRATRRGAPLRPWTIPNLVGYVRLAAIPVFCVLAFSSDDGRDPAAALLYLAIAASDYLDGFLARATGQYSRMGALLDPVVDRLTVLAGAAVCWKFELLAPLGARWCSPSARSSTLILAQLALRRGIDLEINWIGRIGVFLVFGCIFWAMVLDWWIIRAAFVAGVAIAVLATVLYVRAALRRVRARGRATVNLKLKFAHRPYNRPMSYDDTTPDIGSMSDEELKELIEELTDEEREVSYRRRVLHGKIDILRAELVNRLKVKRESGDATITGADVQQLTDILLGKVPASPEE